MPTINIDGEAVFKGIEDSELFAELNKRGYLTIEESSDMDLPTQFMANKLRELMELMELSTPQQIEELLKNEIDRIQNKKS